MREPAGPYLATLGASAAAVGFVTGFGEFIGYAVRLASGYLSDRTGRYWAITIFGYCVNLLAIPLLALAGLRGPMGFGRSSRLHTAKILRLSEDLPMVIEIVDSEKKIQDFLPAWTA